MLHFFRNAAVAVTTLVTAPLFFISCSGNGGKELTNSDVQAARELAYRLSADLAESVTFRIEDGDSLDFYSLCTVDGALVISGNNINSLAMGLGDYLRDYCKVTVTPYVRDAVILPKKLPLPTEKITRRALLKNRFFLNYCTYGYSLPWYQWEDWERMIDWMALNGVNMALANTGNESIWLQVWQQFGLNKEQIREYFTGPAYLPWHRMTNIDKWGGPLPQNWLDGQCKLQKKIIAREHELGISPILSAFTGHVPEALKALYPEADIQQLSNWSEFDNEYAAWYLNPADPLYGQIQKAFLIKQKEAYGQDCHIYGVDIFNEVDPPLWEPEYLSKAASLTYEAISQIDPDAVWLQMAWLFYYDKRWTPDLIEAYVSPVPKGRLIMLDYYCEKAEIYKRTENFYGQDFIWSFLGNFGGRTVINGDIKSVGQKIDNVMVLAPDDCVGLGCTLEGLDVNNEVYEYILSRAWERTGTDEEWIDALADRHLGRADSCNRAAWNIMYHSVLNGVADKGSLMTIRPSLNPKGHWNRRNTQYDNAKLWTAWSYLLQATPSDMAAYRFDCVNFGRQCLSNHFAYLYLDVLDAYLHKDASRIAANHSLMTQIIADVDRLVSADEFFLLGKWIEDARAWGDNTKQKRKLEINARRILTTWGPKGRILTDYANREYNGLLSSYYAPRWEKFLSDLETAVRNGEEFNEEAFINWCVDFEWEWAENDLKFANSIQADAFTLSCQLYDKYKDLVK